MSDDGERFYVAGTTAGMYILNTELRREQHERGPRRGPRLQSASTNVWVDGEIGGLVDVKKLPSVAERLRAPGAELRSRRARDAASPTAPTWTSSCATRGSRRDRASASGRRSSRWSACTAPCRCRTARRCSRDNPKGRPAWVVITEEWPFGPCPERGMRVVNVESEITPMMVGAIAQSDSVVRELPRAAETAGRDDPADDARAQSDGALEPRVRGLARPRRARDRHLQSVQSARGRACAAVAVGRRHELPRHPQRPDLRRRQPHAACMC